MTPPDRRAALRDYGDGRRPVPENSSRCAAVVVRGFRSSQCSRPRTRGDFCVQHEGKHVSTPNPGSYAKATLCALLAQQDQARLALEAAQERHKNLTQQVEEWTAVVLDASTPDAASWEV